MTDNTLPGINFGKRGSKNTDPPPSRGGLDWDAIKLRYKERVELDIANGVDNAETRAFIRDRDKSEQEARRDAEKRAAEKSSRQAARKKPPVSPDKRQRQFVTKELAKQMCERYKGGELVSSIGKDLGFAPATVVLHLKNASVYEPGRDAGIGGRMASTAGTNPPPPSPLKQDVCKRGHDMKDGSPNVRRAIQKSRGKDYWIRSCKACDAWRKRQYLIRKKEREQAS